MADRPPTLRDWPIAAIIITAIIALCALCIAGPDDVFAAWFR